MIGQKADLLSGGILRHKIYYTVLSGGAHGKVSKIQK